MRPRLLAFAILLIVIGAYFGFSPLAILGIFFLFPAILSSPRRRPPSVPVSSRPQPRRVAPPPAPEPQPPAPAVAALPTVQPQASAPAAQRSYSPALFPVPMFPSLSQPVTSQQPKAATERPPEQRDELLEVGTILAILKIALG